MKKRIIYILLIAALLLSCLLPGIYPSASAKKLCFTKKYSKIAMGKSVRFSLRHLNKNHHVIYNSSNKNVAVIDRKTGICVGIKPGKIIISAKVYNKNNKKIITLKQPVRIVKSSFLPNASFHLVQTINPFNYTVKIGCNRILLKKEVQNSNITLLKNGEISPLTASFSNLSSDGKEITYTLTAKSQKKLNPKNGSMDGKYTLISPLFRSKLSLSYEERSGNYSLSGYVLSVEGNPINQAYVKCITDNSIKTCHTDKNGYYRLKKVKNPRSLTFTKSGYLSETLSELKTKYNKTICENIILHQPTDNNFSAQFHVTGQDKNAIEDASVLLLKNTNSISNNIFSKSNILFSGKTDHNGNILFYTKNIPNSSPCTSWNISKKISLSYENNFTPETSHKYKISSFSKEKTYTLLIGKSSQTNPSCYTYRMFTFCPKDFITEQFCFDVTLPDDNPISLDNLSLKCSNANINLCSSLHLSFYQIGNAKPILYTSISKDYFLIKNNLISFSGQMPFSLPDGSYYLKIQMQTEKKNISCAFPMTMISISNGNCSLKELSSLPCYYCRILAYGDVPVNSAATFERYQKIDGNYYYIDTLSSSLFQGKEWDTKTASLILPNTEPGAEYLLKSKKESVTAKNDLMFSAESHNIYLQEISALLSPALEKIECIPSLETSSSKTTRGILNEIVSPIIISQFNATKSYIRNCSSYPNSVIVFYKKNGTLLSAALTTSPSKNIDISNKHLTIVDIYTNGKELFTTQNINT